MNLLQMKTPVNLIKTILKQMGYVDAEQCEELASYFPNAQLIIQWGCLPREACPAQGVAQRIKEVETYKGDYVRSVWFTADDVKYLREVFEVPQQ
jgi:hypothetical protein